MLHYIRLSVKSLPFLCFELTTAGLAASCLQHSTAVPRKLSPALYRCAKEVVSSTLPLCQGTCLQHSTAAPRKLSPAPYRCAKED